MKKFLLIGLSLLSINAMAEEMTKPLIVSQLYAWKMTPNGKWLAGDLSGICDVYDMDNNSLVTYNGARATTITNDGVLAATGNQKPSLIINGEVVVPESLQGARSGSIQLISSSGNRLCGNINYPDAGVNGFYVCDIDENGVVGMPKPIKRPTLDFFGCKPQFVNMLAISDDGTAITGFVQDWRGYYCYPIVFRENENGEWDYSYPTEALFNPENYPIPYNIWLEEPKFPEMTNYMSPVQKSAYEDALANYYMGLIPDVPDAKDYMTEEQWQEYYDAAISYNEWWYGHQDEINAYDSEYNKILFSSVIFDLNEVAISPDGRFIGCSYLEYPEGKEVAGVIKINTFAPEFQKYKSDQYELYTTQILSDGTMLLSQPIVNVAPETYIVLPDKSEMMDIKDYFEETHPDYLAWINEYVGNTGTIYANDDLTIFSGSVHPADCEKVEEVTGGYYSFTYVFSPDLAAVDSLEAPIDNRFRVFSLTGLKILDTDNVEEIKKLPEGFYVINGKVVRIN